MLGDVLEAISENKYCDLFSMGCWFEITFLLQGMQAVCFWLCRYLAVTDLGPSFSSVHDAAQFPGSVAILSNGFHICWELSSHSGCNFILYFLTFPFLLTLRLQGVFFKQCLSMKKSKNTPVAM